MKKFPKKTVNPVWFMYFFSIPDFFVSQPSVFLYEEKKSPPQTIHVWCILYLPTCIIKIYQIWVNIPTHRLFGGLHLSPTFLFPAFFKRKRVAAFGVIVPSPSQWWLFSWPRWATSHSRRWQPSTAPGEDMGVFPKMVDFPTISHPKCWSFLVQKTHVFVGETHHFRKQPYFFQNPVDIPLNPACLMTGSLFHGLLQSPYNWVVT